MNRIALSCALVAALALSVYLSVSSGLAQSALFLVGAGAGVVLYHASFGFTSSWRALIAEGRGAGVRAQMLMLAVTSLVFFPILASGEWFGHPVRGSVSPVGVAANVHLSTALHNLGILEWVFRPAAEYELFPGLAEARRGYVYASDRPGLGIEFREELAAKFPPKTEPVTDTVTRLADGTLSWP